jgi:hypothetical protein
MSWCSYTPRTPEGETSATPRRISLDNRWVPWVGRVRSTPAPWPRWWGRPDWDGSGGAPGTSQPALLRRRNGKLGGPRIRCRGDIPSPGRRRPRCPAPARDAAARTRVWYSVTEWSCRISRAIDGLAIINLPRRPLAAHPSRHDWMNEQQVSDKYSTTSKGSRGKGNG